MTEKKIRSLLRREETSDTQLPFRCLPVGSLEWIEQKIILIEEALPELAKEAGYVRPPESMEVRELANRSMTDKEPTYEVVKSPPSFASEDEEREFWATHDSADFLDEAEQVNLEYVEVQPQCSKATTAEVKWQYRYWVE